MPEKNSIITTIDGKSVKVNSEELLRATINYLRNNSPDNQLIVAEEIYNDGRPVMVPAAVMFLLKNPHEVVYYNRIIYKDYTQTEEE